MKRKSNKKLTIALLALLGVVSAGGTFAYWQGAVQGATNTDTTTITIGEGLNVTTAISLNGPNDKTNKTLVPTAFIGDYDLTTHTDEVTYKYTVTWKAGSSNTEKAAEAEGGLVVSVKSIYTLNASDEQVTSLKDVKGLGGTNDLILITFDLDSYDISFKDNEAVLEPVVTVTVKLTEPVDADQYALIAGFKIAIELEFKVTVA